MFFANILITTLHGWLVFTQIEVEDDTLHHALSVQENKKH